jgi:misacylated tRNA(Ala) deacylase
MMATTRQVYYEDSYARELEATVTAVEGEWIELDRTVFYPEGGGQPGDIGRLATGEKSFNIIDTKKGASPGSIRHQVDTGDHGLKPGDTVRLSLDWDRRYRHMRMHTCLHLLGSLIPVPVTGGSVGADKSRLDFDVGDHQLDKEDLSVRLNRLIEAAHPVRFGTITEQELDEKPELVRTMSVQPPRGAGDIRTVTVVDVDYQPCGGTHIANTREIGPVRVSKIENKGKRNRRVHVVFDQGS